MIVNQIKQLVSSGTLKPGDRLPAERAFAERFGVGRGHVREALKKLEIFGILKTMPQSGTYVANQGAKALEALMADVLALEKDDTKSLLETSRILEVNAARLAAERAIKSDIIDLIRTHEALRKRVRNQELGTAEDRMFHLKIAVCSKNKVLRSLIILMATNSDAIFDGSIGVSKGMEKIILQEHEAILQAIKQSDPDRAAEAMDAHMNRVLELFIEGDR
jgi:GntR family transcriptional repressor for pyruvate dehydrogenase complex